MAECSVDDMYNGCRAEMTQMVETKYKEEIKQFKDVWNNAEKCADRNMRNKLPVDQALTKDHMQAICAYTSIYKIFYYTFNEAVQTGREKYGTSFPYHSFHFLLTIAIQILKKENQECCHTSYRRSKLIFTGNIGQIIRFGSFASSSLKTHRRVFGQQSCFKIMTCYGASLKGYSEFEDEEEVLVPPYEKFKITKILQDKDVESEPGLSDCKVIFIMESAGELSNLNCKAAGI
ncbi:hypothetical protein LDENG_00206880 [Lucifuga dentata]|nr:hypothetical protein LDENG_00206880 [Lucifuga dentata]